MLSVSPHGSGSPVLLPQTKTGASTPSSDTSGLSEVLTEFGKAHPRPPGWTAELRKNVSVAEVVTEVTRRLAAGPDESTKLFRMIDLAEITDEMLDQMLLCAAAVQAVYTGDWRREFAKAGIPTDDWNTGLPRPPGIARRHNILCDAPGEGYRIEETGNTFQIFHNPKAKLIFLPNGGTLSGKDKFSGAYEPIPVKRIWHNLSWNQLRANLTNATGLDIQGWRLVKKAVPESHEVPKEMAQYFREAYPDHTVIATGHSKGGVEAEYTALSIDGQEGVCFCSPPLGPSVRAHIGSADEMARKEQVMHYFIEDDPITDAALSPDASHVGRGYTIPLAPALAGWLSDTLGKNHTQFFDSVLHFYNTVTLERHGVAGYPAARHKAAKDGVEDAVPE